MTVVFLTFDECLERAQSGTAEGDGKLINAALHRAMDYARAENGDDWSRLADSMTEGRAHLSRSTYERFLGACSFDEPRKRFAKVAFEDAIVALASVQDRPATAEDVRHMCRAAQAASILGFCLVRLGGVWGFRFGSYPHGEANVGKKLLPGPAYKALRAHYALGHSAAEPSDVDIEAMKIHGWSVDRRPDGPFWAVTFRKEGRTISRRYPRDRQVKPAGDNVVVLPNSPQESPKPSRAEREARRAENRTRRLEDQPKKGPVGQKQYRSSK